MKLREQIDMELKEQTPSEEILREILQNGKPRRFPERRLLLCAVLAAALVAVPVSAHMFGSITETTPITDENRELADQPDIALAQVAPADETGFEEPTLLMDDPEKLAEVTGGIIQKVNEGAFLPDTITVLSLSSNTDGTGWVIPELLTLNGFTTVFTKENGSGWYLKKGETLQMQYQIGTAAKEDSQSPKGMEIGYICDHIFYSGNFMKEQNFSYTLTAPEDGTYYLYNINCCSGKIHITGGDIH